MQSFLEYILQLINALTASLSGATFIHVLIKVFALPLLKIPSEPRLLYANILDRPLSQT